MFEDSLLESSGRDSKRNTRKPWATIASFAIEIAMVGVLVVIPFIYPEVLPKKQLTQYVFAPAPPSAPAPHVQVLVANQNAHESVIDSDALKMPTTIPKFIAVIKDLADPMPTGTTGPGVIGGTSIPGDPGYGNRMVETIAATRSVAEPVAATPLRPVYVSRGVTEGLLIHRVQPSYPALAKQARISGEVDLQAVIGKDGTIENLQVIGGHPMLVKSALDAVGQWRYRPYRLNGQPVEVETQITVHFTLGGA